MIVKVPGIGPVRVKANDVAAFEKVLKEKFAGEKEPELSELVKILQSVITSSNEKLVKSLIKAVESIESPQFPAIPEKPKCVKSNVKLLRDWRNVITDFELTHIYEGDDAN